MTDTTTAGSPGDRPLVLGCNEQLGAGSDARCWCHTCRPVAWHPPEDNRMILCPDCGNKRCPRATDHMNACTGSNETGQIGSIYGGVCDYPDCNCPFDAPADPNWCAKGLPHLRAPNARLTGPQRVAHNAWPTTATKDTTMSESQPAVGAPVQPSVMQRATGGAAFPVLPPQDTAAGAATGYPYPEAGMTLRDYFAAKAMSALWSNTEVLALAPTGAEAEWVARLAYEQADAMVTFRAA